MQVQADVLRGRREGPPPRGFTLVEIMVAVAIIGLLAMLLVPSLGRAREHALSGRCKANLRQLWEVFHDGQSLHLPAPGGWVALVTGRGAEGLLKCPKDSLEGTSGGRVVVCGGNVQEIPPPSSNRFNDPPEHNTIIYTYTEQAGYVLPAPVRVNITQPGRYASSGSLTPGTIPGGTMVDCQYLMFDPVGSTNTYSSGSITLGGEILGVICMTSEMDASDAVLGRSGTINATGQSGARGYEMGAEIVSLESDLRTYTIHNYHSTFPGEHIRILSVPGGMASYGMNKLVPEISARPDQLLLLDYGRIIVDIEQDAEGKQLRHLALRHLGRSNGVSADGSVRSYAPEELQADAPVWPP